MSMELPTPKPSQPYVHASVLEAGHLNVPENYVIENGSSTKDNILPSMAFLLQHSENGKKIIFDLGLRKDAENFPPAVKQMIDNGFQLDVPVDVVESLRRGGMEPNEVDFIILSHVHFDHIGDPTLFPSSHFIVHEGSKDLIMGGYSPDDTEPALHPDFAKNLLPESRTSYLTTDAWKPIGPFPRALDYFGDGSFYIIDSVGHLPGHINALVRTSAQGSWLYLAGDSAHDVRILTGEKEIGMYTHPGGGLTCMHKDLAEAKAHIERIKRLKALGKVHILLAHDVGWFEENRDKGILFPGKIRPI